MDEDATQLLLTALCKISDAELLEADTADGSWLLAFGGNSVALELGHRGASIRLIGEIGLEPSRVDEVLSNTELCRGMLRFNGDRQADAIWLGLRPDDDPSFVLTQEVLLDGLTESGLAVHLERFVDLYVAWFDAAESMLAGGGRSTSTVPPPPSQPMLRV